MMSREAHQELLAEPTPAAAFNYACAQGIPSFAGERAVLTFKFGGSSLLGARRMLHASGLVREACLNSRVVVVVSAMKGVTDRLLQVANALESARTSDALREAEYLFYSHFDVLRELRLDPIRTEQVARELRLLGKDFLHDVSSGSCVNNEAAREALHDRLASYGERFCARLFAAALEKSGVSAVPVSSSEFVLTCDTFRDAHPLIDETRRRGRDILLPLFAAGVVPVVTGFIGSTSDGRLTTLGRNSSDFSGALVAHVVDATELVIWTDVDGIFTANPHESVEARLLHELSYDEARTLAESGAKVLHAKVLPLAEETEMVVWVRNTFNPHLRGTRIGPSSSEAATITSTRYPEIDGSATAEERSRAIPFPPRLNDSMAPAPRGCHNSIIRGEA